MGVESISFLLKRSSRRRSIAIQVGPKGVVVLAPLYVEQAVIDAFVKSKQAWLEKHLAQQMPSQLWQLHEGAVLPLFDERMTLRIVSDTWSQVSLEANNLWVQLSTRVKSTNRAAKVQKLVRGWYQQEAVRIFTQRLELYSTLMRLPFRELQIKHWQTKWGSCDSRGVICLNWRLLLAPLWVADYVVIHELAHLAHMNHSAAFWQLVAQYCPRWQQARQFLKQEQQNLDLA